MRLISSLLAAIAICGAAQGQDIAIANATVYISPKAAVQPHTTILIQSGKIVALGRTVRVPAGERTLACDNCVVFAGFWNTHVHFTGPQWAGADQIPAAKLNHDMQAMLTHSGFTSVVDTASDPSNTVALRRRIESGEALGPRIYTAGSALYPPHGIPYYLDDLPESVKATLQQPSNAAAAIKTVQHNVALGTDIVKLFTRTYLSPDHIVHMPLEIARAVASEGPSTRPASLRSPV